jgi:hypothetical protein
VVFVPFFWDTQFFTARHSAFKLKKNEYRGQGVVTLYTSNSLFHEPTESKRIIAVKDVVLEKGKKLH